MQQYKIADNRIFQVDGHDFLFLAADNAIFELDSETVNLLQQRFPEELSDKKDFLCRLDSPHEAKEALFQRLIDRRIVLKTDNRKFTRLPEHGRNAIPLKTLVLQVTDACNLGCHYCYYCQAERAPQKKKSSPMTVEMAQKAVDFLFDHSGNLKELVLVFFGGEPLLGFDLISSTVAYARSRASEKEKKIDFAITTNATLLTDKVIRFLNQNRIGVTVSIDGSQEIHDRHRRFPDGSPSYNVILPKIKNLVELIQNKPVVARVTVAKDAINAPEILEHLLDLGFAEAGFAPVTTQDQSYQLDPDEMNVLLSQFKTLADTFLDFARQDRFLGFTNLIDLLVELNEGDVKNYPCGAGLSLFSVDAQGRLYLCQRLTGENRFCMGDLFTGFDLPKLKRFRRQTEINRKETCKLCWARTICAGGCYHEALLREGSLIEPNLHYCEWIKRWLAIGLEVYARLALDCPEYSDKLSLLRGHSIYTRQGHLW